MQFVVGFLLAASISVAARLLRSLSYSGAVAATLLGTIVYGFGGWQAAVLLIVFFVSSSALGRHTSRRTRGPQANYAKGAQRDAGQVLGNGLVAGALAVTIGSSPGVTWPWIGYAGAIAAVTADTWATELGALSSAPPRLIHRLNRRVPAGTSGGVTALGILAAALGAALIAVLAAALAPPPSPGLIGIVLVAGMMGAIFDSLLGATAQSMYRCVTEGIETEQHPLHRCGAATEHIRGWRWLNNDKVNLACATIGALVAAGLGAVVGWA